jgi:hypothetical protein
MGFVWKFRKEKQGGGNWMLMIRTVRRLPFDEELSAIYLTGERAGQLVGVFREVPCENREIVFLLCLLKEGDLLQVCKEGHVGMYILIVDGTLQLLANDFEEPVQRYIQGDLSVSALLAEAVQP